MTEITHEALEALSKKAEQTEDDIRYYSGGSKYNEPLEQLKEQLVHLYRTGQLIHAVPSDILSPDAIRDCLVTTVLATPAQPSGDVVEAVKDAARYRWLRDHSCPPHNFYISVPDEFHGVKYGPDEVDAYIDAARAALGEKP